MKLLFLLRSGENLGHLWEALSELLNPFGSAYALSGQSASFNANSAEVAKDAEAVESAAALTASVVIFAIPGGGAVRTGVLVERTFITAKGTVDFLAEASVVGNRLILKDAILYGRGVESLTGMGRDIYKGLGELKQWAASQGFKSLEIIGTRVQNSTSANPGSVWHGVWDLTKKGN